MGKGGVLAALIAFRHSRRLHVRIDHRDQLTPKLQSQEGSCLNQPFAYDEGLGTNFCISNVFQQPDAPARCVDWCDAVAYCKWAGKRLCGHIGGGGADFANPDDAGVSQWFNACSGGGTMKFAYGDDPLDECVQTTQNNVAAKLPEHCQGSVVGLYGLSSNAGEWEDSCDPDISALCLIRALPIGPIAPCAQATQRSVAGKEPLAGIRCCHDGNFL